MYPRWLYVSVLAAAVGALMFTAGLGQGLTEWFAYAAALGLGGVVFYQGEARVTRGPIVGNIVFALAGAAAIALLTAGGLLMIVIEAPWDLALWQGGLRVWSGTIGVAFAFVTAFFIVGASSSLR